MLQYGPGKANPVERGQVAIQSTLSDRRTSALAKYQDLVVGSRSVPRLVLYECVLQRIRRLGSTKATRRPMCFSITSSNRASGRLGWDGSSVKAEVTFSVDKVAHVVGDGVVDAGHPLRRRVVAAHQDPSAVRHTEISIAFSHGNCEAWS